MAQSDERAATNKAMTTATSASTTATTALKVVSGPGQQILLGTTTLVFGGTVAVTAGVKTIVADLKGAKVGDRLYPHPDASFPTGFLLGAAFVPAADKVEFRLQVPAIVLGTQYQIPITVIAARSVAS